MTVLYKWSGDDVGGFDYEPTAFSPVAVYSQDGDNASLLVTPAGAQAYVGKSPLGSPASISGAFSIKLTGYPSSSVPFLAPLTSSGTSAWRFRVTPTGTIIVDDQANAARGTSAAVPLNTWVLVKFIATTTSVRVRLYNGKRGGSLIGTELLAQRLVDGVPQAVFGLVDNLRIGNGAASPVLPPYHLDDLVVTDGADWVLDPVAPSIITSPTLGVIGDSNTAGMGANGSYYYDALTAAGVSTRSTYFWGVGGKRIAAADLTGRTSVLNVRDAKTQFGTIDAWVIALGTNDRPQDDATVNSAIDTLLAEIGPAPRVVWIGLTSKGSASADDIRVNNLVKAKLVARGNAEFADWDAHIRAIDGGANPSPYWLTTDTTHMTPLGYQERAKFYASLVAATSDQSWESLFLGGSEVESLWLGTAPVWP